MPGTLHVLLTLGFSSSPEYISFLPFHEYIFSICGRGCELSKSIHIQENRFRSGLRVVYFYRIASGIRKYCGAFINISLKAV